MTVGSTPKFKRQLTPALLVSLILWLTVASEDTALGAAALGKTQWGNRLQPALTYLYLPTVTNTWKQHAVPVSPADGAVLDTLIPTLTYRSVGSYANATMCVAFDVNPHPTWCSIFTSYDPARTDSALLWTNLLPSTTYYWRVATIFDMSTPDRLWSEERSFRTAPTGGVLLPAPNLVSPTNGGAITLNQAILNWSAVTGAVEYGIYVSEQGVSGDLVYFQNSNNPLDVSGDSHFLVPGHTYQWYVVARNDYAWGAPSSTWSFTITASSATQALGHFGFR